MNAKRTGKTAPAEKGDTGALEVEHIQPQILLIRGSKVILDSVLAGLYRVETKTLKRAVNRNRDRFPSDFMFQLTPEEYRSLRRQIGTLKRGEHAKYPPYAFTEQGVAMLSSVLRSKQAVQVNIAIMRVFVKLRETLSAHRDLAVKLSQLERRIASHDEGIQTLFEAIRQLMSSPDPPRKEIGFHVRERRGRYRASEKRK